MSGETLKANTWDLSFRMDFTEFRSISRSEAEQRALAASDFDTISNSLITTASFA